MATVTSVTATALSYLNDSGQTLWTSALLTPFLQEAHREMQLELNVNGLPVIKQQSVAVTVPAIDLSTWPGYVLMPSQPTNIIEPINCFERPTGDTLNSDWDEMIQKSFIPNEEPINDLVYWSWMGEKIVFLGSLQSNDIKLEYNGGIAIPSASTDTMGFINAEAYIAPKMAALAADSIGATKTAMKLHDIAQSRLEKILQYNVLAEQGMVTRRKPYRHGSVPFVIR